jgi:hypothetical protein
LTISRLADNHADHYGGAIYSILDTPTVRNSVLWGNTAEKGAVIIGTAAFVETIVEGGCPIGVSCTHAHSEDPPARRLRQPRRRRQHDSDSDRQPGH